MNKAAWVQVPGFKYKISSKMVREIEANFLALGYTNSVSGLTAAISRMYCERNRIDYKVMYGAHGTTTIARCMTDRGES